MAVHTVAGPGQRAYRMTNPATGEVVREWNEATDDEAFEMLARAHTAYLSWRETPVSQRVALFRKIADIIDAHADELGRQVSAEMGKPLAQSIGEVSLPSSMFRYYADHGEELLADEPVEIPGFSRAYTRREPVGVVLGVEPWNVPLYQAMRATVPNLMLGNTVLVKPARIVAGSTLMLDDMFREAGFPPDVYRTALISTDQVAQLIADSRVRAVTMTGSDTTGSVIGGLAGRNIKPVVLELGGSDAFVVLDSADPVKAAGLAASCRLAIGGQVCASPKRVIVTEKNADAFIARYAEVFASQKVGDPFDPETTVGPLSTAAGADLLQEQLQDAIDKGATVVVPGGRVDGPGAYFKPAVLTDVKPGMRLYEEEAFGPLGVIYRVPDAAAAVVLANSTKYGLGGTVIGDTDEAERVAHQLDTGTVGINTWFGAPIQAPFGGTKASGVGRELGRTGMDPFANMKSYGIA